MPVIGISVEKLMELIGKEIGKDELLSCLEQLGCDIEGYTRVSRYKCEKCGNITEILPQERLPFECSICGSKLSSRSIGETEVVRMELLPVRPDMFDAGGLARALRGYLNIETGLPTFKTKDSKYKVTVLKNIKNIRPFIACSVIRNLNFTDELVKIMMKLQENLHWALGRDRRRASIGIYDLESIKPDFTYKAVAKDGLKFVPLGMEGLMTPSEIFRTHPKGKAYSELLENFKKCPILLDSKRTVLSIPPIINSESTKVTLQTKDIFIDVTGLDHNTVNKTLAIIASSLSEFGGRIETIEIDYPDGTDITPDLKPTLKKLSLDSSSKMIGTKLSGREIKKSLERMRFGVVERKNYFSVKVPPYRTDIKHEVDLVEDVAIAYGYHNITPSLVPTMTIGEERGIEKSSDIVRQTLTGLGFFEIMTLMLTNTERHYKLLRLEEDDYAEVKNPVSMEQTIMRTHLLSGVLETLKLNISRELPQRIFEIGDVCVVDAKTETGAVDIRKVAGGIMGPKTGYAEIRSYVEAIFRETNLKVDFDSTDHPSFIEGRAARLVTDGVNIGIAGEVHPEVLENFGITHPVTLFEINLSELT